MSTDPPRGGLRKPPTHEEDPNYVLPQDEPGSQRFVFRRDLGPNRHQVMIDWLYDQGAAEGWFLGVRFTPEEATRRLALFRSRLTHQEQNDYVGEVRELPDAELEARVRKEWAE